VFLLVPLAALAVVFLVRRLQTRERISAIEKGVPIPGLVRDPLESARNLRRGGIVLVSLGLGLFVLVLLTADTVRAGVGVGAVPLLLGVGLLLEYFLERRDLKR
jgi:hypothetical protein